MLSRTREDLIRHIYEQLSFLHTSCQLYDQGRYEEAKRIAQALRILLHTNPKKDDSESLYSALGLTYLFKDTSGVFIEENLIPHEGLIFSKISITSEGEKSIYEPRLGQSPTGEFLEKSFMDWWENAIVLSTNTSRITRRDLVLLICNKDGGAHVAQKDTQGKLSIISSLLSSSVMPVINDQFSPFENRKDLASIRQIGHEVLETFSQYLPVV